MKKLLLFMFAASAMLPLFAQQDQVLMTIDGKPIMASEFMYIYEKNNQGSQVDQKSLEEYVDLFVNFKLKVIEAESMGIDTTESFRKELKGYRAQATPKYMQDTEAIDSLVRLSYAHMSRDRRAAHIAIQCPMTATAAEDSVALQKIQSAYERVTTGRCLNPNAKGKKKYAPKEDFYDVAVELSSDPSVKDNRGELGWITPFRYVYPFEQAVYATPVGSVSKVFRSAYGYHIALVEEEAPHEEVMAAHIMKTVPRSSNDSLRDVMKTQIDSIYAELIAGADFEQMAKQVSDDKGSAIRGGQLGWFSKGVMVNRFEQEAFALQPGEISKPFASQFGWHIIKMYNRRGISPLDSIRSEVEKKVMRDERMKEAEKMFIEKTRVEYELPDSMSDKDVRDYADAHLEEKYEDLRHLVQEYHDGILLFEVSLKEVWDKASKDTLGLQNYFAANRASYPWSKPRYKGYLVSCKDKGTMRAAKGIIRNSNPDSIDSYLNQRLNLDSTIYVKFSHGVWEEGQNAAVDKYGFKQKNATFQPSEALPYVFVQGKVLSAPEEYTDERGKVTTDYQDYLEKQWVEQLRQKYPVQINQQVLQSLKK